MKNKDIFIALSFALLICLPYACENPLEYNETRVCDVENPLEELPWLKDIKYTVQISMGAAGSEIIQYKYKGRYVFWVDLCYMCPDNLIQVFDCQGEVLCEFGGIDGRNTCIDFEAEASDSTLLFRSINN